MREDGPSRRAALYVESVVSLARQTDAIVSVIVFGSFAKGGFSGSSDVDLILVVSDNCRQETVRRLNDTLETEAIRLGLSRPKRGFGDKFFSALSSQTGMFVSHFVARENDLLELDFSRMFSTNRMLAWMIAPKNIVLAGVLSHAKTIFGKDLLPIRKPTPIGSGQLARSLTMNLLLAVGALGISPFTERAIEFSLEATKWSLFAGYYFVFGDSPGINTVAQRFISRGIIPGHVRRMLALRDSRTDDKSFILKTPLAVMLAGVSVVRLSA